VSASRPERLERSVTSGGKELIAACTWLVLVLESHDRVAVSAARLLVLGIV
jgi:hypothetical protein